MGFVADQDVEGAGESVLEDGVELERPRRWFTGQGESAEEFMADVARGGAGPEGDPVGVAGCEVAQRGVDGEGFAVAGGSGEDHHRAGVQGGGDVVLGGTQRFGGDDAGVGQVEVVVGTLGRQHAGAYGGRGGHGSPTWGAGLLGVKVVLVVGLVVRDVWRGRAVWAGGPCSARSPWRVGFGWL